MMFLCLGNSLLHIFGNWLFESASWTGKDRNGVSIIAQRSTSSAIDIQDSEIVKMQQRVRLFLLFSLTHSFLSSYSLPSLHSLSLSLSLFLPSYFPLPLPPRLRVMKLVELRPSVVCVTYSHRCHVGRTCCTCTSHVSITRSLFVSLMIHRFVCHMIVT